MGTEIYGDRHYKQGGECTFGDDAGGDTYPLEIVATGANDVVHRRSASGGPTTITYNSGVRLLFNDLVTLTTGGVIGGASLDITTTTLNASTVGTLQLPNHLDITLDGVLFEEVVEDIIGLDDDFLISKINKGGAGASTDQEIIDFIYNDIANTTDLIFKYQDTNSITLNKSANGLKADLVYQNTDSIVLDVPDSGGLSADLNIDIVTPGSVSLTITPGEGLKGTVDGNTISPSVIKTNTIKDSSGTDTYLQYSGTPTKVVLGGTNTAAAVQDIWLWPTGAIRARARLDPFSDNQYDLGGSGVRWKNFHLGGDANITGITKTGSIWTDIIIDSTSTYRLLDVSGTSLYIGSKADESVAIPLLHLGGINTTTIVTQASSAIRPKSSNTTDIGLTGTRYKDLYLTGSVYAGQDLVASDSDFTVTADYIVSSLDDDAKLRIEAGDAYAWLVSKDIGNFGSGINLVDVSSGGGTLNNSWTIIRRTNSTGTSPNRLDFKFGSTNDPGSHTTYAYLTSSGDFFANALKTDLIKNASNTSMFSFGGNINAETNLLPKTNNTYDLGSASIKWANGFFNQATIGQINSNIYADAGGTSKITFGTAINIKDNLVPDSSSLDLGATGNPWDKLYVNDVKIGGAVYSETNEGSEFSKVITSTSPGSVNFHIPRSKFGDMTISLLSIIVYARTTTGDILNFGVAASISAMIHTGQNDYGLDIKPDGTIGFGQSFDDSVNDGITLIDLFQKDPVSGDTNEAYKDFAGSLSEVGVSIDIDYDFNDTDHTLYCKYNILKLVELTL